MSDKITSYDEFDINELSDEDLAVLHAFEAMNQWPTQQSPAQTNGQTELSTELSKEPPTFSSHDDEEMFSIFTTEAEEDITSIRLVLDQLEQCETEDLSRFIALKKAGHKLYGTAGAVGFPLISTVASQVELFAEEVSRATISPRRGIQAIAAATTALEYCLHVMTSEGQEPDATSLLASLEAAYQNIHIDLQQLEQKRVEADRVDLTTQEILQKRFESESISQNQKQQEPVAIEEQTVAIHISSEDLPPGTASIRSIASTPSTRVDTQRFEHLVVRTEKLVEQRAIVEEAQAQVECALQELYIAQARLKSLEPLVAKLQKGENVPLALPLSDRMPVPSLIARILHESVPFDQRHSPQKDADFPLNATQSSTSEHTNIKSHSRLKAQWDELEIDRYNEQDILQHALKDAIADLSITTANVQSAFTHFSIIQQDYLVGITHVHRDTLLLRQVPFKSLVPRLERVVAMSAPGQARQISFEVIGEDTEIDQDILDALATPLIQFLRTCLADPAILEAVRVDPTLKQDAPSIWLKLTNHGNRLLFEVGFSMPIEGEAIETIRQSIQHLHGTISLQRNSSGGMSFFFHIPHPHSSVFCLLVRAGDQHLLIPFSQIEYIGDEQREHVDLCYSLHELLGYPKGITTSHIFSAMTPLLILASEDGTMAGETVAISVDEVLGEQECIVKPLPPYLQRPGIAGTTIDGKGRILLMIDLFTLIRSAPQYTSSQQTDDKPLPQPHRAKILVTDDSAALRHSLSQTLRHASYTVFEARDGVEALEKLQQYQPDICLLDVEMPNLNGYEVLEIISADPAMSKIKVIMLTARNTVKHMQYALALGASAYLTKPCSQDDLFQAIERTLKK